MKLGGHHSAATIAKIRAAQMGHLTSPETRAKIAASHKGMKRGRVPACPSCNRSKGPRTPEEWFATD